VGKTRGTDYSSSSTPVPPIPLASGFKLHASFRQVTCPLSIPPSASPDDTLGLRQKIAEIVWLMPVLPFGKSWHSQPMCTIAAVLGACYVSGTVLKSHNSPELEAIVSSIIVFSTGEADSGGSKFKASLGQK
jgi:hypothetical protein